MPTRNVSRTPGQDACIESVVTAGDDRNASEAVRDALRALQQRRRDDALRVQINAGRAALARGAFAEVADDGLDGYLEGLALGGAGRRGRPVRGGRGMR
jgi:antitoxin ParD1/3/4